MRSAAPAEFDEIRCATWNDREICYVPWSVRGIRWPPVVLVVVAAAELWLQAAKLLVKTQ